MKTPAFRCLTAGACIAVSAFALNAQSPGQRGAVLDGKLLRQGVDTFYVTTAVAGRIDTTGRMVQSLIRKRIATRAVLLQVYEWRGRDALTTIDSLTMDARTLVPLAEVRYSRSGNVRIVYSGRSVRATVDSGARPPRVSEAVFGNVAYSSSATDALARAVPLSTGSRQRIALYYPFPSPVSIGAASYEVLGPETVQERDGRHVMCWVIAATFGDGVTRFWVNAATRQLIRIQSGYGSRATVFVR